MSLMHSEATLNGKWKIYKKSGYSNMAFGVESEVIFCNKSAFNLYIYYCQIFL